MSFIDRYFFSPNFALKALAITLLPLSLIYAIFAILNANLRKKVNFNVPIISVGNLSLAGNGKTPICKAIAREFSFDETKNLKKKIFVILRGYKRKSRGLVVVKLDKDIKCDVKISGDEAMEYALDENIFGVIVSEKRESGIEKAKQMGAQLIILDDAFSKFHIEKFDILLESKTKPYFDFVLPSGAYRLPKFYAKKADFIALEGRDFFRFSSTNENMKAILVTAIAKPFRLYEHFIKARACYFFADHHFFTRAELDDLLKKHNCDTLMLTFKDFVKIKDFGFKCQIIELRIELAENFKQILNNYLRRFNEFS